MNKCRDSTASRRRELTSRNGKWQVSFSYLHKREKRKLNGNASEFSQIEMKLKCSFKMKLFFSVTEIVLELSLYSHGNAKQNYCDNYLCVTTGLFNDPCPLSFS